MSSRAVVSGLIQRRKSAVSAAVDLAIVLAVVALCFLAVPTLNPILRRPGHNILTVLAAMAFQLCAEGVAPFALMALRRETFSSYGFVRRQLAQSLGLALVLAFLYDAALSWHTGALLWIPLRRQPAIHNSLALHFPVAIIGLALAVFAWGFTEGFFGIYFAQKVNVLLRHDGMGWFAPGVLAFAFFNGIIHTIVGQGWEGFLTSFASGYAITVVPAVTRNAWGGALVQALTNAVGRL